MAARKRRKEEGSIVESGGRRHYPPLDSYLKFCAWGNGERKSGGRENGERSYDFLNIYK